MRGSMPETRFPKACKPSFTAVVTVLSACAFSGAAASDFSTIFSTGVRASAPDSSSATAETSSTSFSPMPPVSPAKFKNPI